MPSLTELIELIAPYQQFFYLVGGILIVGGCSFLRTWFKLSLSEPEHMPLGLIVLGVFIAAFYPILLLVQGLPA